MKEGSNLENQEISLQYNKLCCLAIRGEAINCYKQRKYMEKNETLLGSFSETAASRFYILDEYRIEGHVFTVLGYNVHVQDSLIADALLHLSRRKREVILLSYFLDMTDYDIARELHLVQGTIFEHRRRSLKILRGFLEERL